jgi:hypothetical protein
LISNDLHDLLFLRAFQPKRHLSRTCETNTGDINKVIHRNFGFLAKPLSNQALAGQTAKNPEQAVHRLAQIWG